MAQPITWHTVTGPSLAEASRPMEAASRSFNEAFSGLDNVLKQRQAIEAGNWDQTKLNNTNALLGAVQEPKTPEEFAAKEAQLRQMLTGYGAQVDPIAARAALDGRMATLQQRGLANIQYTGAVAEEADRPKRDLALSLYAQGKFAEGDAVAAEVQRNKAALYEASRTGQRRVVTDGQADTKFGFDVAAEAQKVQERPLALDTLRSNLLTAASQRALMAAQAENQTSQNSIQAREMRANTARAAQLSAAYKDSIYGSGDYTTADGKKALLSGLKELQFHPAQINDLLYNLGKQYPNGIDTGAKNAKGEPIYAPLPINFILDAAAKSDDNSFAFPSLGFSRRGDDTVNKMAADLKNGSGVIDRIHAGEALRGELIYKPLLGKVSGTVPDAPARVAAAVNTNVRRDDPSSESALDRALRASKKKVLNQR